MTPYRLLNKVPAQFSLSRGEVASNRLTDIKCKKAPVSAIILIRKDVTGEIF
jgi:hypothetical protein